MNNILCGDHHLMSFSFEFCEEILTRVEELGLCFLNVYDTMGGMMV